MFQTGLLDVPGRGGLLAGYQILKYRFPGGLMHGCPDADECQQA